MIVKFINYSRLYTDYDLDDAVKSQLVCGKLILQDAVQSFERDFSRLCGKKYAVGVSNGTDAIYMALTAMGVGVGDEVITTDHTFKGTISAILHTGARPVTVDIDENGLMDLGQIKITSKTKAIVPVHLAGDSVNMKKLMEIASVPVIEDACQAIGAKGPGLGIMQCYSHYPAKTLGCLGDGGSITTDDEELANELKDMRNHYKDSNKDWGGNYRLDNIQAAVLVEKMKCLDRDILRRRIVAEAYNEYLRDLPIKLPRFTGARTFQDYIIRTKQRDELQDYLDKQGIQTLKNEYPFPAWEKLPKAKAYEKETLRLPCNPYLTDEQVDYVIEKINEFYV